MNKGKAKKVAFMGLFFALAMVLSFLENLIPTMPNGIKPGLSNIVVMYVLFFADMGSAYTMAFLKALFALVSRGATSGLMSLAGGLLSVTVMALFMKIGGNKISYLMLSVLGGISHNAGQIIMARFIMKSGYVFYYFPVLLISGILMGVLTGISLKFVMPFLRKISPD